VQNNRTASKDHNARGKNEVAPGPNLPGKIHDRTASNEHNAQGKNEVATGPNLPEKLHSRTASIMNRRLSLDT